MDFNLFPLEIKFKIISFLTDRERKDKVSSVSNEWRTLADDPYFRRELVICYQTPDEVTLLLTKYYGTRKLKFFDVDNWDWMNATPKMIRLRQLILCNCRFAPSDTLVQLIARFPSITELHIISCVHDTGDCTLQIPQCKSLQILKMSLTNGMAENCTCIDTFTQNCTNLKDIAVNPIIDSSLIKMATKLGNNLQKLCLSGEQLTDNSYQSMNNFHQLIELSISPTTGLNNVGLWSIKKLTQLQSLQLLDCTNDLIQLFEGAKFPQLVVLHISSDYITNQTTQLIATSCCQLQELLLSSEDNSEISDDSVISVVRQCRRLIKLSLWGLESVSGEFLNHITTSTLPNLQHLRVPRCSGIVWHDITHLRKRHPKLRINGFDNYNYTA